ncbi:MAG: hypothetical protein H7144_07915 [Burkholderiales bacterium]|nr:hypothetical protein [Phycisphaerae bacterium]
MSLLKPYYAGFIHLSRAAVKATAAKIRGAGLLRENVDWPRKAETCERCPLRVVQCGVSYCGKPFLQQIARDPVVDGCGCPTRAKAKDPKEHCPLTSDHLPAVRDNNSCNCKWCNGLNPLSIPSRT